MTGGKKAFSDMELMLYADGELPADEAHEVAAWLAEDEPARLKLESLRQAGEAVRTYTELETDRAEVEVPAFAEMWQRIERRIHANGRAAEPVRGRGAPVLGRPASEAEAGRAGGGKAAPLEAGRAAVAGRWEAIRRWFDDHRGHVLTGAISAGVACALMLATLGPRHRVVEVVHDGARSGDGVTVARPRLVSQPPEVEDLEVYEGSGTILTIEPEGDDDSAATVIWISNDQGSSAGSSGGIGNRQNREGPL